MYPIKYPNPLITRMINPDTWMILPEYTMHVYNLSDLDAELLSEIGVNIEKKDEYSIITLPEKQASDLGSIPKFLQWWLDPWDIAEPSIFHDYIHQTANQYFTTSKDKEKLSVYNRARKLSDTLLHDGVKSLNRVSAYNAQLVYLAVRIQSVIRVL